MHSGKPPLEVWLGPARSGKTRACIDFLKSSSQNCWLVLQTEAHAESLKANLESEDGGESQYQIATFAKLLREFAMKASEQMIRASARNQVISSSGHFNSISESYFSRIQGTDGFNTKLCELIRELKLSAVSPEQLRSAGESVGSIAGYASLRTKAREVSAIYADYEAYLKLHDQEDDDGLARAAAANIVEKTVHDLPHVVILDGYYRLALAWRIVLRALAQAGCRVIMTLPFESSRPSLFRAPARTLASLEEEFELTKRYFVRVENAEVNPPLIHLERELFDETDPEDIEVFAVDPGTDDAILIIDSPNPYAEAEAVLREVRLANERDKTPWNQITIVLRSPAEYGTILPALAERFKVPLCVQEHARLMDRVGVKAAAALMRVVALGWKRADVLEVLKFGTLAGRRIAVDRILKSARRAALPDGPESWTEFGNSLSDRAAADQLGKIASFHSRIAGKDLQPFEYAFRFRELMVDLDWLSESDSDFTLPDQVSLSVALQLCDKVSEVHQRISSEPLPFREWSETVLSAWNGATEPPRFIPNRVLVVDAYDSRQRASMVTAVMGLTERSFPRRPIEDPFFRDDERALLKSVGLPGLESRLERTDEERLLFYLAISSCTKRLILSYPRTSTEGDFLPSFYIDDVRSAVPAVRSFRLASADITPVSEKCVDDRDVMLNELALVVDRANLDLEDATWREKVTRAAAHAGHVPAWIPESIDLPPLPGLTDANVIRHFAQPRRLSVTEIESYNRCPFQHITRFRIQPITEFDGTDAAQRGRLYHQVITRAFRRKKAAGNPDGVRSSELHMIAVELMAQNLADAALYKRGLFRRFLDQSLEEFATRESDYSKTLGGRPEFFELAFGLSSEEPEREYDSKSTRTPLSVSSMDGSVQVNIAGVMDRVDVIGESNEVMVMDYKTGSPPKIESVMNGESLQMPIYLLALEGLFGMRGAVACYDSARSATRTRLFRPEMAGCSRFGFQNGTDRAGPGLRIKPLNEVEYSDMIEAAKAAVIRAAEGMSALRVLPSPGDHCRTCECRDFCRTSLDFTHDGETPTLTTEV